MTVWYVLYCVYIYDTGCCYKSFIGVVEDDGMISGGEGGVVDVVVVEGMRREISRTKNLEEEVRGGDFSWQTNLRLTTGLTL